MRLGWLALAALPLLAFAPRALAHSVSDEVTAGATQATPSNPSTWYLSNKLTGVADLDPWQLRLDLSFTHDAGNPPPAGASFATSPAEIFLLAFDVGRDIGKHWNVGLDVTGSPPASSATDSLLTYSATVRGETMTGDVDTDLVSRTWSVGGGLYASYDTASDSSFDTVVDGSVGVTWFDTTQRIAEVYSRAENRALSAAELLSYCHTPQSGAVARGAQARTCTPPILAALGGHSAGLAQLRLGAGVTETIHDHTDVGLAAAYYLYSSDPTEVGYFSKVQTGRNVTRESSFGAGVPIAPYLFTVTPSVAGRVHGFSAALSFQLGEYLTGATLPGNPPPVFSYDLTLGLKLQYKWSRALRTWVKGSAQRDVDSSGVVSWAGYASVGARYSF